MDSAGNTYCVREGNSTTGTWARPATPMMEKVGDDWVSKGWNELEHKGWLFKAVSRPACADADPARSALGEDLGLGPLPLPQRVFPENVLACHHRESGLTLSFTTRDTLSAWLRQQQARLGAMLSPDKFDWTYGSPYSGSIDINREILRDKLRVKRQIEAPDFGAPVKCRQRIPMEVLQGRGHIHFYDQVDLIADSLGGRGSCEVTTKIRVMDDFFLVLLRCYIVINGDGSATSSVFLRDVRYFHRFGEVYMLRDEEVREASAAVLQAAVTRQRPVSASVHEEALHDQRFYTSPDVVWETLSPSSTSVESIALDV